MPRPLFIYGITHAIIIPGARHRTPRPCTRPHNPHPRRCPMPTFTQDIRPLFRERDVEEMRFAFDLSDYDDVKEHAAAIYAEVENGNMPCDGPWPEERVALFKQWLDAGSPR